MSKSFYPLAQNKNVTTWLLIYSKREIAASSTENIVAPSLQKFSLPIKTLENWILRVTSSISSIFHLTRIINMKTQCLKEADGVKNIEMIWSNSVTAELQHLTASIWGLWREQFALKPPSFRCSSKLRRQSRYPCYKPGTERGNSWAHSRSLSNARSNLTWLSWPEAVSKESSECPSIHLPWRQG